MSKVCDEWKFFGKVPKEGIDYIETDDTFTIFNVPILAEMVQEYDDGYAYKSKDEILKVEVNNIPLTIVDEYPTHPDHIRNLDTFEKKDVIVGYMSEPAKPRKNLSKTKRYADFVLPNTKKIDALKQKYLSGSIIDTSIGFDFDQDNTTGKWNSQPYDYIQKNIKLDHNAILIDRTGNTAVGRMPAPIGGIGADSATTNKGDSMKNDKDIMSSLQEMKNELLKNNPDLTEENAYSLISDTLYNMRYPNDSNGGIKLTDEVKKQIDSLTKENVDLKNQIDSLKNANETKDVDSIKQELDTKMKEADELKVSVADMKTELDDVKAKLKVYTDKEQEDINSKKDELKKHYADLSELFDKADNEFIMKKFDELKSKKDKKDIGADMFGVKNKAIGKKEETRFNSYVGKTKEKGAE